MKKIATRIALIAFGIFVIDWGVVGLKLLNGNYDITVGAYIGLACLGVIFICAIYKVLNNKCPHCGKVHMTNGEYCSYCGKKIR